MRIIPALVWLCLSWPAQVHADDWQVRRTPAQAASQVLELLDRVPDSDSGLSVLVSSVGLRRATQLADARARKTRRWQAAFVAGRLWSMRRDSAKAERAYAQALGRARGEQVRFLVTRVAEELVRGQRLKQAEQLLRRRAQDVAALELLVQVAQALDLPKLALKTQQRIVQQRPHSAEARIAHARMLLGAGELEAALREQEQALRHSDGGVRCELLRDIGSLKETLERFDEALQHYRSALSLATPGEWAHRDLQQRILDNYRRRGLHDALTSEAERLLKSEPRSPLLLRTRAEQAQRRGQRLEALRYYERYLEQAPQDSHTRSRVVLMLVGIGQSQRAVPHSAQLVRRNPRITRYLVEHAALLGQVGQQVQARKLLRDELARLTDADGLQLVATALEQLGDTKGADLAFAALLRLGGRATEMHELYGRHLWNKGRRREALRIWTAGLTGPRAGVVGYETWVEVLLSLGAERDGELLPSIRQTLREGLVRHRRHPGLLRLAARCNN